MLARFWEEAEEEEAYLGRNLMVWKFQLVKIGKNQFPSEKANCDTKLVFNFLVFSTRFRLFFLNFICCV